MKQKSLDLWVGLFVMLGTVALLFLALKAGNLNTFSFNKTYTVSAQFSNIGGLKVQAPVKSAGVIVGRVANIQFNDQTFSAIVSLNIDDQYHFPKDSSAKILTSGLLGDQYISLEAGGSLENLASGDKISMTQSAIVLENLIGQFLFNKAAEGKDNNQ